MNKFLTISFTLLVQILLGQQKYQFEYVDVNEIKEIEKANSGIIKDTVEFKITKDNFKSYSQTKTFIYKRENDDFSPKLHVWYHIDTTNKELIAITYNWDFYNPSFNPDKNEKLLIETNKRESEYQNKYNELNKLLKEKFKEPTEVRLINDSDYSFNEMTFWEDDELYAYSRIRFQRRLDKNPMIGLAGNHFVVQMVISYK